MKLYLSRDQSKHLKSCILAGQDCRLYLGNGMAVQHFELQWTQSGGDINTPVNSPPVSPAESQPRSGKVELCLVRDQPTMSSTAHSIVNDVDLVLENFEQNVKQACLQPLMSYSTKMQKGDSRVVFLQYRLFPDSKVSL